MENFVLRYEDFLSRLDPNNLETRERLTEAVAEVVAECRRALAENSSVATPPIERLNRLNVLCPSFEDTCRCIRLARNTMLDVALRSVPVVVVMSSTPTDLLVTGSWDEALLATHICNCSLAALAADSWKASFDPSTLDPFAVRVEAEIRTGLTWKTAEGLVESLREAGRTPIPIVSPAFAVAFENPTVVEDEARREKAPGVYSRGRRLTRAGVRILERASLFDVARESMEARLGALVEASLGYGEAPTGGDVERWFKHCVHTEANNQLLLRLDEWALLSQLRPLDASLASGERGGEAG